MGGSKKWIGFALLEKKKKGAIKADRPAPRNIKALYHCRSLVQGFGFFFPCVFLLLLLLLF